MPMRYRSVPVVEYPLGLISGGFFPERPHSPPLNPACFGMGRGELPVMRGEKVRCGNNSTFLGCGLVVEFQNRFKAQRNSAETSLVVGGKGNYVANAY
ncbi:hypothetical protein AVEN_183618-1 [Araneus ventricosus]|uniref:Uncharacterized protein n=1 Tax=Araneus ventricosus TaxID=182803 RepID=A0A4Y2VSV2_ARAVE|nr:hypothetical protein AVEN_183618-1 [Araneus ventricosus]